MSFLLDTDICSAYLKNDQRVVGKVMLHFGGLHVSVITVGELLTWARRAKAPPSRLQVYGTCWLPQPSSRLIFRLLTNLGSYGPICWIRVLPSVKWICSMVPWH